MSAKNLAVPFVDLAAQQARIGVSLRARLAAVLAHGQYILGPEVAELEQALAGYCGAAHCVSVGSGTDALQIAMMAEEIGLGDAVFLPAFTYTATAEVPLLLGAVPVFVDVDPHTFQINPAHLEARIEEIRRRGELRPRAVIGVDLFGQPAPWPALREMAAHYALFTLDDCAQAFGASLGGERPGRERLDRERLGHKRLAHKRLGREAVATAISFFPSKPLGAYGDGGALFTEDAGLATLYRSLRSHGEGVTRYDVMHTGVNSRLDTMQAAILLAKLEVFDDELAARARLAGLYDAALADVLEIPARVPDSASAWAVYAVLFKDQAARDKAQGALRAAEVGSAIYYPKPLHHQPAYRETHDGAALPVAEQLGGRILALPIHPYLSDDQVRRVVQIIRAAQGV